MSKRNNLITKNICLYQGCTNTTFSPWIQKSEASWLSQTSPVEIGWTDDENSFLLKHETAIPER